MAVVQVLLACSFLHHIHHRIHKLKRRCPVESTLHKGVLNVCLSVLSGILDSSSKHSSDSEGAPLPLLQRNCSDCFCTTHVTAMRQLGQPAYKAPRKENHRFLYNTTKQVVEWNRKVMANCNHATWNLVECSRSKRRNMGFERLKKGRGGRVVPQKIPDATKRQHFKILSGWV